MGMMQWSVVVLGLLCAPGLTMAQGAAEISDDYLQIIGDPGENAAERIRRSIALLGSRANVEEQRGNSAAAQGLRAAITSLEVAPVTREASQLAAEAVVAAESGRIEEAQILAESAAVLQGGP